MNKERFAAKVKLHWTVGMAETFKGMVRTTEFEKIEAGFLPIYLMRFERNINCEENTYLINKGRLRGLTFEEFFMAVRNSNVLEAFSGECLYLKGKGIGEPEGYRKITDDGKIGDSLDIRVLRDIPRDRVVYVYPGKGKQMAIINNKPTGPLFVLSGTDYKNNVRIATIIAGRRKFAGLEGLAGQKNWMPDSESRKLWGGWDSAGSFWYELPRYAALSMKNTNEIAKKLIEIFRS